MDVVYALRAWRVSHDKVYPVGHTVFYALRAWRALHDKVYYDTENLGNGEGG